MKKPNITVDIKAIESAYSPDKLRARQAAFAQRVALDMRKHVPVDEGTLRDSADLASNYEAGRIIWDAPYAKDMLNADSVGTVKNPHATPNWPEVTKSEKLNSWKQFAKKLCDADGFKLGVVE